MSINQTLKGAVAEYLENITSQKSDSSKSIEKIFFNDMEKYFLDKCSLVKDVSTKDIDFFQASLLKTKKPQTVNRQFTVYNHFFKKCVEWCYVDESPTRFCKKKREFEPVRVLWDASEIETMLRDTSGWLFNVLTLLSRTGIRPVEMSEIRKKDIDENGLKIFCEKNSHGYRVIPINKNTFDFLVKISLKLDDEDFVFTNERGNKIKTSALNKKLKKLQKKLGMKRKLPSSLRHTYATGLCRKNVSLEMVRLLLGHKKIVTTQKYLKVEFADLQKVVNSN